jgi:uncharacterized protein (TIGR02001 family)
MAEQAGRRTMKVLCKTIVAGGLLTCASIAGAAGETPFSTNVALTTDYVFRGVSQSAEDIAIQGGFDFNHKNGFYAGLWGSNVDFAVQTADDAHVELDIYAGYGWKASNIDWDAGIIRYTYPGAAGSLDYDFTEFYIGGSYGKFSAKYSYADEFFGSNKSAYYLEGAVNFDIGQGVGLGLHIGKSDGDAFKGGLDYTDYKVSVEKDFGGFGFELAYTDTDASGANQIKSGAGANDGRVVLTVSKSM